MGLVFVFLSALQALLADIVEQSEPLGHRGFFNPFLLYQGKNIMPHAHGMWHLPFRKEFSMEDSTAFIFLEAKGPDFSSHPVKIFTCPTWLFVSIFGES